MPLRKLVLIHVAFHPPVQEVGRLRVSLSGLPPEIGYGVVVNDYRPGEPVEQLRKKADFFLGIQQNLGYGRAINRALSMIDESVPYLAALNTDLEWDPGTFEKILEWLDRNPETVLAVPQIVDSKGKIQLLCKRDPTILALLSRRFIPSWLKPKWLLLYDSSYVMESSGYACPVACSRRGEARGDCMDVPYLSGCCMVFRAQALRGVGGFDERYFLYLEDADITRKLRRIGRCVHLHFANIYHRWGRGSYRNGWLALVNLHSAWVYFQKWGWRLW